MEGVGGSIVDVVFFKIKVTMGCVFCTMGASRN